MRFGLSLSALAVFPLLSVAAPPAATPKPVDVVLCLDTSNSMDGLIDSAKRKLWAVVNDLAKMEPAPSLRVGLYSYGNNTYDRAKRGWVRKEVDLTTDLDEVYKRINALRCAAPGSDEFVARVTRDALAELKWADDTGALRLDLRLRQRAGGPGQGGHPGVGRRHGEGEGRGRSTPSTAGRRTTPEAAGWAAFATRCGGKFANIDQDRAKAEVVIKTPFDDEIQKLGAKINETYLWYGLQGGRRRANQLAQDRNAAGVAGGVAAERSVTKAGRLYKNAECDLIDRMLAEKDFDLKKLKEEDLPAELKKLKPEEREGALEEEGGRAGGNSKKSGRIGCQAGTLH